MFIALTQVIAQTGQTASVIMKLEDFFLLTPVTLASPPMTGTQAYSRINPKEQLLYKENFLDICMALHGAKPGQLLIMVNKNEG